MVRSGSAARSCAALGLACAFVVAACGDGESKQYEPFAAGGSAATAGSDGKSVEPLVPSCAPADGELPALKLTAIATVVDPVQLVSPPGDPRLFVVSRRGDIYIVERGLLLGQPFLSLAVDDTYAEVGLLGLAFSPNYAQNGLFYLHYVAPRVGAAEGDLVIAEFERSAEPNRGVGSARRELIRLAQPTKKHKGGSLAFDSAGLLYIAVGNGGEVSASGDTSLLRGKILRIDPAPDEPGYAIPADNPHSTGWAPEILESGLRNPWRIALDPCTDDLYIGDVGNATYEEVNISPAHARGHDFGFPSLEGDVMQLEAPDSRAMTLPVAGYGHDEGCALIGGVVYRGSRIPALRGTYLYADHCAGFFRSFRYEGGAVSVERDLTADLNPNEIGRIVAFGSDARGEVYVLSHGTNAVYRIDPE